MLDRWSVVSQVLLSQSHFVINIGVAWISCERLLKRIQSRGILFIGVMSQAQHAVGIGVLKIHAESGTGFSDSTVAVLTLVEHQCQAIMDFGKVRFGFFGTAVFVESRVPVALLLLDVSQREVQRAVLGITRQQLPDKLRCRLVLFLMNQSSAFQQPYETTFSLPPL